MSVCRDFFCNGGGYFYRKYWVEGISSVWCVGSGWFFFDLCERDLYRGKRKVFEVKDWIWRKCSSGSFRIGRNRFIRSDRYVLY